MKHRVAQKNGSEEQLTGGRLLRLHTSTPVVAATPLPIRMNASVFFFECEVTAGWGAWSPASASGATLTVYDWPGLMSCSWSFLATRIVPS